MASEDLKPASGGIFSAITSSVRNWGSAMHKSVNGLLGYEGLEVINPEGGTEDAEEETQRGRWKQEDRDSYWKMMHKSVGSVITSMVTLPVIIFEPMTVLQKMAELMEYCHLLDLANACEDPYMRLVYASSWAISVYFAYQRMWKPFNPILGETYEMVNHRGITFIAELVWRVAAVPENDKFEYTYFAHRINSFVTAPKKLLASDSRLRPNRFALENGKMTKAGSEKASLEERQRAEKRNREAKGHQFTPSWFDITEEVTATPWGDLEVYQYNGKYTTHRVAIDCSDCIEEVDIKSIEVNPWQYAAVSAK